MDRRGFVQKSLALAAAGQKPVMPVRTGSGGAHDIIVVGGGTAGLALTIAAAARGVRVLVIEKAPILGGTLDRSGASVSAAGTSFQAAAGIRDTPEAHVEDIVRLTQTPPNLDLLRLWTSNAAEVVEWLRGLGVSLKYNPGIPVNGSGHEYYTAPRNQIVEGGGQALLRTLGPLVQRLAADGRIDLLTDARVVELLQRANGEIFGVSAETDGGRRDFHAGCVVLTAGGCTANPRLYQELHGVPLYYQAGYPFNQGDGLLLGQSVGGFVRGGEAYCPLLPIVLSDDSIPSEPLGGDFHAAMLDTNVLTRPPAEIWVNARGERFVQEDSLSPLFKERALRQQPGHRLWAIHDQTVLRNNSSLVVGLTGRQYADSFAKAKLFFKADRLADLAVRAGLNPRALESAVATYNGALIENQRDALERRIRLAPLATPPYFAVQFQGYTLITFAGLAVDGRLRVIRPDGTPIPNLYAAGEVLGGTAIGGSAYANGSFVTSALAFGRHLGQVLGKGF